MTPREASRNEKGDDRRPRRAKRQGEDSAGTEAAPPSETREVIQEQGQPREPVDDIHPSDLEERKPPPRRPSDSTLPLPANPY